MSTLRRLLAYLFIALAVIGLVIGFIGVIGWWAAGASATVWTWIIAGMEFKVTWGLITFVGFLGAALSFVIAAWLDPDAVRHFSKRLAKSVKTVIDGATDVLSKAVPNWVWYGALAVVGIYLLGSSPQTDTPPVVIERRN